MLTQKNDMYSTDTYIENKHKKYSKIIIQKKKQNVSNIFIDVETVVL